MKGTLLAVVAMGAIACVEPRHGGATQLHGSAVTGGVGILPVQGQMMCRARGIRGLQGDPRLLDPCSLRLRGGGKSKAEGDAEKKAKKEKKEMKGEDSKALEEGKISKKSSKARGSDRGDKGGKEPEEGGGEKKERKSRKDLKAASGQDERKEKKRSRSTSPSAKKATKKSQDGGEADAALVSNFRIGRETTVALAKKGITSLFPIQVRASPPPPGPKLGSDAHPFCASGRIPQISRL